MTERGHHRRPDYLPTSLRMASFIALIGILFFALFSGRITQAEPVSAEKRVYRFAVTDIVGLEELQREFHAFQDVLNETTGYTFQLFPVTGRTVVVESLRAKRLDIALTGPAEYVAITSRTRVRPIVGLHRPNYQGAIIAKKDSGITKLTDLKQKRVGFGDFGSTSYHLAPLQLLADENIDIKRDIRAVNLNKYVAWKALQRGQVSALGFNRARFEQFVDEDEKVKREDFTVVAVGPELPEDLFIVGEHVPEDVGEALRRAFLEHGDQLLSAMLVGKRNAKYSEMKFITDISDNDYDYIRQLFRTAGLHNLAKSHS
ncbi:PhnD/SsuA/transferrin family substrate-binding protein [bacterium]|nr:PhnD/SsuA/transferrin family substrate-binding protein [bacterium]